MQLGLLRTRPVGKALLCSWNSENKSVRALLAFLKDSSAGRLGEPNDEAVYRSLKRHGAPLLGDDTVSSPMSLERSLAYGLALARRHPAVARVWPVVFARNRETVKLDELKFLACRLGQKRTLGFLLSLTGKLLQDESLVEYAEGLRDARESQVEDFFLHRRGKRAQMMTERNTPEEARAWLYRMNMPWESFRSHFLKFQGTR
jgi:hypothetical protein